MYVQRMCLHLFTLAVKKTEKQGIAKPHEVLQRHSTNCKRSADVGRQKKGLLSLVCSCEPHTKMFSVSLAIAFSIIMRFSQQLKVRNMASNLART